MFPELLGAVVGMASSAYGAYGSYEGAKAAGQAQQNITGLQEQQDAQRQNLMELQARRSQMEVLRNNQRARSLALNNSTSQGAQFGSGLQGGYGQQQGQSGTNLLGIDQNLTIGRNQFNLTSQIDQQKILLGQANTQEATSKAISGFGSSLSGSIGKIGNLFGGSSQQSQPSWTNQGNDGADYNPMF